MALPPPGPFVAKADASTGRQIWRTYLDNVNVSGHWIAVANLNILPNGNLVFAWSNYVVLLDGDTGAILRANTLPSGEALASNSHFKHVTIAPDGTLIIKNQIRPTGETGQGAFAMIRGAQQGLPMAPSIIHAVDPNTLQIVDSIQIPEVSAVPRSITMFDGKIAIYVAAHKHAFRYFWDPATKKLSQDASWVVPYLQPGQSDGTALSIMGDWVVIQTNGIGSKTTASSVVAINQHDPSKKTTVFPFGPLKKGEQSFAPPKNGSDAETHMVYSQDLGVAKVAGIKLEPKTGAMNTVFVVDDRTTCLVALIGPKDKCDAHLQPASRPAVRANDVRPGHRAIQGTGALARCSDRAADCAIRSVRADVGEHAGHTGLWRAGVLPDRQGVHHHAAESD